ncbi:MAG: Ig-like domain-containing protein [Planctomycetota bacterium]
MDLSDSSDGFNALNNPTLTNPGAVTLVFSTSLNPASVINLDPTDPQGSRNVRLFYFDTSQGPFDPNAPTVPGVNPPGANVLIAATTILSFTNQPNDTLIIRPSGFTPSVPMPAGQYSIIVEKNVQAADSTPLNGAEYFFFYRVEEDQLSPVVVTTSPANGETNVSESTEIRVTMSETIRASTVDINTIQVFYQPTGFPQTAIPGSWFSDGGNGPGNNFPDLQLDADGIPGFTGQSPRNGADLVFRPDLDAAPINMLAEDPNDIFCTLFTDPPEKGNRGFPLGQSITVRFNTTGLGVTDTAGNQVIAGSPMLEFTFETADKSPEVFAPGTRGAVYFGDAIGVGVIDVDPSRTPYLVGTTNPVRGKNTVVALGSGPSAQVVRVEVPDLVGFTVDTRPYTAFHTFICGGLLTPSIYHPLVYAASKTSGGGEIVAIDSFKMEVLGRWNSSAPGGVAVTALAGGGSSFGRAAVSNFSANTVTVYDIAAVGWYNMSDLGGSGIAATQATAVGGAVRLILNEADFDKNFPSQTGAVDSPSGPFIIGIVSVGVSPAAVELTNFPSVHGTSGFPCFGPFYTQNTILGVLNAGESTADFSELTNLGGTTAIQPDLDGISISSQPKDFDWTPVSGLPFPGGGATYYAMITAVGGTIELFATGFSANAPTVRGPTTNLAPNKIVNNVTGLQQPNGIQWITNGQGVSTTSGYSASALISETGNNRLAQVSVTQEFPSNRFEVTNANHSAGLGPSAVTGDPVSIGFFPCGPRFTDYFVANTGEGTVRAANYVGGVIGQNIDVPGVIQLASFWSR